MTFRKIGLLLGLGEPKEGRGGQRLGWQGLHTRALGLVSGPSPLLDRQKLSRLALMSVSDVKAATSFSRGWRGEVGIFQTSQQWAVKRLLSAAESPLFRLQRAQCFVTCGNLVGKARRVSSRGK